MTNKPTCPGEPDCEGGPPCPCRDWDKIEQNIEDEINLMFRIFKEKTSCGIDEDSAFYEAVYPLIKEAKGYKW